MLPADRPGRAGSGSRPPGRIQARGHGRPRAGRGWPARAIPLLLVLLAAGPALAPALAQTPAERWPDYEIILWHRPPGAAAYAALPRLGYSGALVFGQRDALDPEAARRATAPLRAAGLRWYVENIATDFYSAYHRWQPGLPVNHGFLEAQRRYRENPADPAPFHREPSLSDPAWLARIGNRLAAHARLHRALAAPSTPLFLNLGDEPGIADLSAAWDFDLSPHSLAGFRDWLRGEYPSLAALNAQWGTGFAAWEAVMPETTDATLAREDGRHAAWSDFKAWMDVAFARAVRAGRDAVHAVDPALLAGLGGGQRPGWGGWDYGLLAPSVDLLETYDFDGNAAIARGFNPGLVLLSTSFLATPAEWHRLWRQVLLGMRGTVVWDERRDIVAADGRPGPRGLASAAEFAALRGGIPAQILAAEPVTGAVGLLYSQPSFRLRWLLDRQAERRRDGASWAARGEEVEHREENAWRAALRRAQRALAQAGVAPRWLTPAMLAAGVPAGLRVLVLPHAIALGPAEVEAVRAFAARGGLVLADAAEPGIFDGHGWRRPVPALAGLPLRRPAALARDTGVEPGPAAEFTALLAGAGAAPGFVVRGAPGRDVREAPGENARGAPGKDVRGAPGEEPPGPAGLEVREFRTGTVRLLALQRDPGPGGQPAGPLPVTVELGGTWQVRRLGNGPGTAPARRASLTLDGVRPAVLALSPAPLPGPVLTGPDRVRAGEGAEITLGLAAPGPAAATVLRLELLDPAGAGRPDRAWNLVLRGAAPLTWRLPASAAEAPGPWTLRVTELLGGAAVARRLEVLP